MNPETIIRGLLKACGFDPATFIPQMQKFLTDVATSIKKFDGRMDEIHTKLDRMADHLEYIKPGMHPVVSAPDPALLPPPLEGVNVTQLQDAQ